MSGGTWESKSFSLQQESDIPINVQHRALFERLEGSISFGFASMTRSLTDLQLQLQIKLRELLVTQQQILNGSTASEHAIAEFQANMKSIDRAMESFTAHADNLSHIKLTISRAANFVAPEGKVASLISRAPPTLPPVPSFQQMLQDFGNCELSATATPPASQQNVTSGHVDPILWTPSSISTSRSPIPASISQQDRIEMNNLFKSPGAQIKGTSKIPNATCFVFYLPPIIGSNEALRALFMPYGTVLNAYVAMDKITGRTRGFGFVDFSRAEEASAAIEALDKYSIGGKFLHVSIKI